MWKRIQQMLSPRSFRFKVILTTVICIVIPTIITLYFYSYYTKDALKEQAILNANRELKLAGEYVTKIFDDMLYAANFVQLDSEINMILKENAKIENINEYVPEDDYQDYMEHSKVIKTIENITLLGEKSYVTILLKNGKHYTNYSTWEYNPENLFNESWFKELEDSYGYETIWIGSQPTVFKSDQKLHPYQISVARTLRDSNFEIYGYVIVTLLEDKINQAFKSMPGGTEMMLVDSGNQIISHPDNSRIGEASPYISQLSEKSFPNIIEILNQDYLYSNHKIPYNGWELVSITQYNHSISKLNSIFNKVFIAQVISFIIFILLLTYLLQTITKPLVRLGNVVERVQSGNLKVRSQIRTKDEIGRLAHSFDSMLDRINEMIREITETQIRKRKAEFAMLQAQINPHFLFNVLNSIRMKVMRKGDYESAEMISSLSKLLRMTIDKDKGMIPFKDEVEIVEDFVKIMNMRQKEQVELVVNVSPTAHMEEFPRFILQPIIENSIIHGLNQGTGTITLEAYVRGNDFIINVEDNGQGMDEETLSYVNQQLTVKTDIVNVSNKKGFSSLGLSNVYERMRMTFGEAFTMKITSVEGKGTKILMLISRGGNNSNV